MKDNFETDIINWFLLHKRDLPWRTKDRNPYEVWISEIMLQQTRVEQMLPFYHRFLSSFPDLKSLANAEEQEVLKAWEGLGYYSRARNLHFAAKQVVKDFNGKFPSTYKDIIKLKGIGPYTGAAIASTVFNEKQACVDGNVYRVLSRVFNIDKDISDSNALQYFKSFSESFMSHNFGNYNEGLMELGATICKPKETLCLNCPLLDHCELKDSDLRFSRPVKSKKVKVSNIKTKQILIFNKDAFVLSDYFNGNIWKGLSTLPQSFEKEDLLKFENKIQHKLTHRNIELDFYSVFQPQLTNFSNTVNWSELNKQPFPKPILDFITNFKNNELKSY